jgi:hypothetical protein
MDQVSQSLRNNSGMIGSITLILILLYILYVVYNYLYPSTDPTYTSFLKGQADARQPITLDNKNTPTIHTGGDFTVSMWVYIDDWSYLASNNKFLFAISPASGGPNNVMTGVLTANQNNLLVTASQLPNAGAPPRARNTPLSSHLPDFSKEPNLRQLLSNQTSISMFKDPNDVICNMVDIQLQRWVCITVVVTGNMMDTYLNGKLSRSCVLDSVVYVPSGSLVMRLGENGGFGGRYSSVQMWGQQLTPDVIYGIYQMGPTQSQADIFTRIAKLFNLNVSFTGSAPGQPVTRDPNNPFVSLLTTIRDDAKSVYTFTDRQLNGNGPSVGELANSAAAQFSMYTSKDQMASF